jgi:hypothetical protein
MSDEAKTYVDNHLESFLASEIAIPTNARSRASISQNHLRQILANKSNYDPDFPILLSGEDSDFIGGSFARHTKIWPLDDIDIYFPMDGAGLAYYRNDVRLPYWVVTDDFTQPQRLLSSKWKRGDYLASDYILDGFRDTLKNSYPSSRIRGDRHAVCLSTTIAATSQSSGIGFDIVPCFCLQPDDGTERIYLMPDGNGHWIHTNPRVDTDICAAFNQYHHDTFRKAVRLVKYWNKERFANRFSSYFIELAICRCFIERRSAGVALTWIVEALAWGFYGLKSAYDGGSLESFVPDAPQVVRPTLTIDEANFLKNSLDYAYKALESATSGEGYTAILWLQALLGSEVEA